MTAFWLFSGLAAALAALTIMAAARRGAATPVGATLDEGARQLSELEALRDRGLMDEASYAAARAEAGRRLLAVDDDGEAASDPRWARGALLGGLAVTAALAAGLYAFTGSPGLGDQPYAARVDDWAANLEGLDPPRLAAVAERVAAERPGDVEAQTFLGRARFEAGDPIGAATALRRAIALNPDDAMSWARLGEALTVAQQGTVGADAEAAFREALNRDPANPGARYFLGQAAAARGEAEAARDLWEPLLAALPPGDARRTALEAELEALSPRSLNP